MAKKVLTMAVPASVSAGASVDITDMTSVVVAIAGTFTATYSVQVSFDGTNFVNWGSALSAAGTQTVPDGAVEVRINCTAYTSGTPSGALGGLKA